MAFLRIINSIKTNARGVDGLSIFDIKLCIPHCIPHILHIINQVIIQKKFPSLWKQALVKPVAKNNNPTDLSDFRPISLLSVLSKILERHIHIQITEFLNNNKLESNIQSGFRKNHSTSTALTHLVDDFLRNIDEGRCICLVMIDFSKAFDTLDHSMLLAKLHYLGFSEFAIDLMRSYLNGRKQAVVIDNNGELIISSLEKKKI